MVRTSQTGHRSSMKAAVRGVRGDAPVTAASDEQEQSGLPLLRCMELDSAGGAAAFRRKQD
jgi:hypothetical protein